ncbi:RND transporter, partial [Xanthomonas perforans]
NVGVVGVYKALGGWKQDQAPAAPVAVVNR